MSEDVEEKAPPEDNKDRIIVYSRREGSTGEATSGPPVWLISFTDVIALMLTFFVLLYAMSNPDVERWEKKIGITQSARADFGGERNYAGSDEGENISRLTYAQAENLDYIEALLQEKLREHVQYSAMSMSKERGKLYLYFDKTAVSSAKYNGDFLNFLDVLIPLFKSLDNKIVLVGRAENDNGFVQMQALGKHFRDNGYKRPLGIQILDTRGRQDYEFAISIEPDNGRRITR